MKVLRGDPAFAAALDARQIETYQPIPTLALNELPDGRIERRIAVGLLPRGGDVQHEIVAVDLAAPSGNSIRGARATERPSAQPGLVRRTARRQPDHGLERYRWAGMGHG